LFGEKHVRVYWETTGDVGHLWHRSKALLLTTKGRNSGEPRTTALAYVRVGDNFVVLMSNGGAPEHPGFIETSPKSRTRGASKGRGLPRAGPGRHGR
jgi:deazaflavin-dependent oxidoreductase (nitroreductase family)